MTMTLGFGALVAVTLTACHNGNVDASDAAPPSLAGVWTCRVGDADGGPFTTVTLSLLSSGRYSRVTELHDGSPTVVREDIVGSWEARDGQFLATIDGGRKHFLKSATTEPILPAGIEPMKIAWLTQGDLQLDSSSLEWGCKFVRARK
jgi:hypothetical protein